MISSLFWLILLILLSVSLLRIGNEKLRIGKERKLLFAYLCPPCYGERLKNASAGDKVIK